MNNNTTDNRIWTDEQLNEFDKDAEKIVIALGNYANNLGYHHIGLPLMDECEMMEMKNVVSNILKKIK